MEEFSRIIKENIFLFLFLFFAGGILVGILGVRRNKQTRKSAVLQKPSDYILGMYSLFIGEIETAVKKLSSVVEKLPDAVEVYLALGNIYRNRGQLEKAIKIHKDLLKRSGLTQDERILALDALGTDYRVAGLLDRALQTFKDALAFNPKDTYALSQLVKLSEDRNEWDKAYEYAKELFKKSKLVDSKTLSYQLVKKGETLEKEGKRFKAYISYKKAIKILPENTIGYLNLIRLYLKEKNIEKARETFEKLIEKYPQKFHYVSDLIKELYPSEYEEKLKEIALSRHYKRALFTYLDEVEKSGKGEEIKIALETLVKFYPRSRTLHKKIFKLISEGKLEEEFIKKISIALSSSKETLDPFVCIHCGYKTQDILLRCPNCKEWNSFADTEN